MMAPPPFAGAGAGVAADTSGLLLSDREEESMHGLGVERHATREREVHRRADRIEIDAMIDVRCPHLLRRHECRRAEHGARRREMRIRVAGELRDAEIEEL